MFWPYSAHISSEIFKLSITLDPLLLIDREETSRRMRSLVFLLVLVLFCSVRETSSSPDAIIKAQSVCCEGFTNKKIPLNRIVSYQSTTSDCPFKAIVFNTVTGKKICVDPENTFVIKQVAKLDSNTKV